ncbi:MAG: ABC transporter ATP-binding protein, partial [Acidobacteriota bacterium]
STLLRCLAGLIEPQKGEVRCRLESRQLATAERRRAVGYSAPDLQLYSELTALENLAFFARLRALENAERRGRELLERVGLPPGRDAGALSSGMRQRLRFVWALLHKPSILLLDEPLQNLDAAGRHDVCRMLGEHLEAGGLAVVANPDPVDLPRVDSHVQLAC